MTKKMSMRKVVSCFVVFVILASAVPVSVFAVNDGKSSGNPSNRLAESKMTALSGDPQYIKFQGTAVTKESGTYSMWWVVTVAKVISGPHPGEDTINVGIGGGVMPKGYVDPDITPGDKVEVYGRYSSGWVSLTQNSHYIKRIAGTGDGTKIIDYTISSGAYCPGNLVRASMIYKNNENKQIKFKGIFEVRSPTGEIYSTYKTEITPSGQEDEFAAGDRLLIRIPEDASTGWYDARLELSNYDTGEKYDGTGWIPKQFRIKQCKPSKDWSEDIRITNDPADSINPKIAVDSKNNIHIVWEDNRDGSYGIYYTKIDNKGNKLVEDKKIVPLSFSDYFELSAYDPPSIAIDSNGNIHLSFIDYIDSAIYEVLYLKLDNTGNVLSSVKRGDSTATLKRSPDIAVDSQNNVHIVWEDYRSGNSEAYYVKLGSTGYKLVDNKRLSTGASPSGYPCIATDSNNNAHVAWGGGDIYYTKVNSAGSITKQHVLSYSTPSFFPSIAAGASNNVHVCWAYSEWSWSKTTTQIHYAKLNENGGVMVHDKQISDSTSATHPVIAVDSNKDIHVVWRDWRDENMEIYYKKLDNTGNGLSEDTRLTIDTATSAKPDIACDSNNCIHVTWEDSRDGNNEIYYKTAGGTQKLPVHNIDTAENFAKIQEAIDDSETGHGHTITVDPGTYNENVNVTKSLTIRSTSGNPADTIVQAANSNKHVFNVTVDYVNISAFTVTGATGGYPGYPAGIYLYYADNCIISSNNASNNNYGFLLYGSGNNTITNNNASNIWQGIWLDYSNNNTVKSNNASFNGQFGIWVTFSNNNTVIANIANSNDADGIFLDFASNSTVTANIVNSNEGGIWLWGSSNNTITANNVSNNNYGVKLDGDNNSLYHNNFINNVIQAEDSGNNNLWNDSYPSGGNYWSDYKEKYTGEYGADPKDIKCGPNQDQPGSDGIWDEPYKWIDGSAGAEDNYPLVGANINLINIYTTKTNSEYERVFKYETDFKIIAVLRNNGTGIGHIRAGDLDITINDLYEDKEIAVLKNSEEYDIPAGKSLAINFTWNCSKENATWNESGFTFIGKKFKANATFGTQSKEYEFYIDEFGIPEWLRNVNFVEPPLFSITEPLPDDLKGEIKHLLAADVDNDNKNELVLHTFDSENKDMIILYEYTADSKVFIKGIKLDELDEIQHMIVADLDNDKKNELLLHTYNPNENQHRVETYRCENGKFKNVISDLDLKESEIQHMIVANVDNDKSNGDELVLHTCDTGGQHRVETYRCENGKFKNVISDLDLKESEIQHMIVANVDNDKSNGDELVLHTCDTGGQHRVETYRHEAGGFTKVINDLKESKIQHMIVADVDNDNDNELILHTYFDFPLPTDKDHWIVPYKYNKDTKKFEKLMKKTIIPESAEFGESEIQHMVVADIDNDNDNELLLHTHGIVAGHWIVPYDFEGGKFVKNDATKFKESEIKHMVVADVDNDNYNELVLHKHDFKHPVPPEVIDDNLESDLLLGIYNITKDRPEVEYHMMILYRLDEDFLRKNYENVANKAKNYGFNCGGFGNYYDYGLHESHQISTIQCWFPASNSPLANYDDPPKYILEEITAGDKDEARKLIQRLIDIFPKDLRVVPYTDPSAIYSPDYWWNLKHNDEILLSSNLVGYDGTVAHKNSDNERWARFDKNNKIKRADYAETLPGFSIGLSDLNHLAVEICPSGPSKKGLDHYPSTVVPGYSDEQPDFDYGFHSEEIDINSPMPQDVSYHYELVWQAKYLIEHYGFKGIHCDDTGRLIMDTSLVGHLPPPYADDVWTGLLFPKPPSKSLYGTCENSKYCQKLRNKIGASPDGFDLNSYSNMLKHIRWQVKSKDTDKFLFTDPYFVPSDVEFENGEGEKTWWKSIHASTDVLSTDQFCIWHYSFARWAYETFNSGYRVLRTDLRRTLLDQPDPLRTLPKKALAERPDLTRGVLLATAWANKVHCDLNDPRDAKLFSKAEDEWGDNETLVANYVKMRSKLQELYKDHDIGVPLFSDEESQELLYHKQFTNSNIHYLKDPTLKNVNVKGEYEFVGGKVCNLEEAASEPYTILYTLPSEYGEKGRILHVMNSRVISNLKENNKVPTDYTFMIKIPEGEDINNIYLASPDFYNENVDPDRDGNPTEYEQQNFISNITDKKREFWWIVFENGQKYIKIKVPHVIAYTAVLMEFKELEESIEPAEEIARKYFPNIYQLQCDIDAPKNNGLVKVGYSVKESKDEAKIEYNLVFKDEDHPWPWVDAKYDAQRKKDYGRIEDIETFYITVDLKDNSIKEIDFSYKSIGTWYGKQSYDVLWPAHVNKFFEKDDISNNFEFSEGHMNLYLATWNHLFSNVIQTEGIPTGCDKWEEVANFSLSDEEFVNKGRDELKQEYGTLSVVMATCPVDIVVEDPDGLIISKESIEVPNATYEEIDITEDGEPDDIITLPNRKIGDYKITVIPEPDAKPTDTYSLEVSADDTTIILAENVTVGDIPDQPYTIESTETGITQPLVASFTYSPENPVVNEIVTFDASDSKATGGHITNYKWNFGDESTGTGKIITHAYSSAGNYDVTLTVTDDEGAMDKTAEKITVSKVSNIIYVPDNYPTIQAAVNAASPGETIIVRDGGYTENIDVNKRLTIKSENSAEKTTVQAANYRDHVFEVTANYVTISGFTVKGATKGEAGVGRAGICLNSVEYCNIIHNSLCNNYLGIQLGNSNHNTLNGNIVHHNIHDGIRVAFSNRNDLKNNTMNLNDVNGLAVLYSSNNNAITDNIFYSNAIYLQTNAEFNLIQSNEIYSSSEGIVLHDCNSNYIKNNNIHDNTISGIRLTHNSSNNIISNNQVCSNNNGMCLYFSSNNSIYQNNFINNNENARSTSSTNIWNSPSKITYVYNGNTHTSYLGNYWDDYSGSDANGDGIGDVSYLINSDKDNYPLMHPWEKYFGVYKPGLKITIISPEEGTIYPTTSVDLIYTVNEPTKWTVYSLNGAEKILIGNTTLEKLLNGPYNLTIYAEDFAGNVGSNTVNFRVFAIAPTISNIKVNPTCALPGNSINISADVFDSSGIRWVRAFISKGGEHVVTVFMSDPDEDGIYTGTWSTVIFTESGIYNIDISATETDGNEALAKGPEVEIA